MSNKQRAPLSEIVQNIIFYTNSSCGIFWIISDHAINTQHMTYNYLTATHSMLLNIYYFTSPVWHNSIIQRQILWAITKKCDCTECSFLPSEGVHFDEVSENRTGIHPVSSPRTFAAFGS